MLEDMQLMFDKWTESEMSFYEEVGAYKCLDPVKQDFVEEAARLAEKHNLEIKDETLKGWISHEVENV
jgi:hypothetical protein